MTQRFSLKGFFAGLTITTGLSLTSCTSVPYEELDDPYHMTIVLTDIEGTANDPDRVEWENGHQVPYHVLANELLYDHNLLFLGEIHDQNEIHDTIFSDQALFNYKQRGVIKLMLEETTETSPEIMSAELDKIRAKLAEKPEDVRHGLRLIVKANDAGITLVPIDPQTKAEKDRLFAETRLDAKAYYQYQRAKTDGQLASNIVERLDRKSKAVVLYGAGHGSDANDGIPETIEAADISMARIDVYKNAKQYREFCRDRHSMNAKTDLVFPENDACYGADLPDLVYFAEEGTVHFTEETPDYMREMVANLVTAHQNATLDMK